MVQVFVALRLVEATFEGCIEQDLEGSFEDNLVRKEEFEKLKIQVKLQYQMTFVLEVIVAVVLVEDVVYSQQTACAAVEEKTAAAVVLDIHILVVAGCFGCKPYLFSLEKKNLHAVQLIFSSTATRAQPLKATRYSMLNGHQYAWLSNLYLIYITKSNPSDDDMDLVCLFVFLKIQFKRYLKLVIRIILTLYFIT